MLVEVVTLDEKVGEPTEGQMAADHVTLMGGTDRKVRHPAHFKQGHRTLPQDGVPHGHKLSVLGFPIEQEQNPIRAEVQRIGLPGRRGRLLILPVHEFVGTASPDGKPHIDATIMLRHWHRLTNQLVHSHLRGEGSGVALPASDLRILWIKFEFMRRSQSSNRSKRTYSYNKQFKCLYRMKH